MTFDHKLKLAIIDSSDTWYAQPKQIHGELIKMGHECLWLARPNHEGAKINSVPPGYITICIANNLGPIDFNTRLPLTLNHPPLERAYKSEADFVFVGDKTTFLTYFNDRPHAFYMPYAVNADIYKPIDGADEIYDVGFVGNITLDERRRRISLVRNNFNCFSGDKLYMDRANEVLNRCKIIFNTSDHREINMRVFEALATGRLLVTDTVSYLDELFEDGVHLVTYSDESKIVEKIAYYLKNEKERKNIARNGLDTVRKYHTYRHRAEFIIKKISQSRYFTGHVERVHLQNAQKYKAFYEKQSEINRLAQERLFDSSIPDPDAGGMYNIRERLKEALKVAKGKVLDIGCQRGGYCYNIKQAGMDIVGIDISHGYLKMAKDKVPEAGFALADAQYLPFEDASFDTVLLSEILEHVNDEERVVAEVTRVLKPDGVVFVTVPAYEEPSEEHVRFLTKDRLAVLFEPFCLSFQDNFKVRSTILVARKKVSQPDCAEAKRKNFETVPPISGKYTPAKSDLTPDAARPDSVPSMDHPNTMSSADQQTREFLQETSPAAEEIHKNIRQVLIGAGKTAEAIFALERLLARFPDFASGHNDLGYLYYTSGDTPRAKECYEHAVRLDPTFSTALKNLADFYFVAEGRMEEALELYRKVLAQRPDDVETLIALGQLCARIERIEDSIFFFRRVLELDSHNSKVRELYDKLLLIKKSLDVPPMADTDDHLPPDKQMHGYVSTIQMGDEKAGVTGTRHLNILLTNHHLTDFTGSEVFTFTIADFLKKKGHRVTVLSKYVDDSLRRYFNRIGVTVVQDIATLIGESFDVAHIHHNVMAMEVRRHFKNLPLVFLSHGVIPFLEQNPPVDIGVSRYLAVSEEVRENLIQHGVDKNRLEIFRNIVDSRKFSPRSALSARPSRALILSNKLDPATETTIRKACARLDIVTTFAGMRFGIVHQDYLPDIINQADIVFTLGRGVIETMLCGRVPIVLDHRGGDGMVTPDNVEHLMKRNFSGRTHRRMYSTDELIREIGLYEPSFGGSLRRAALIRFDADQQIGRLVDVYGEAISYGTPPIENSARILIDAFLATVDTTRHFSHVEASRMNRSSSKEYREIAVTERADSFLSERLKKLKAQPIEFTKGLDATPLSDQTYDILIPIFNAFEHLRRCLDSVLRHAHGNHAIYLLDDCSTDHRVLPLLRSYADADDRVRVIEAPENRGFVQNVNRGFELSENDVVILNSDTEVTDGWLDRMHQCLNSHPDIGIVCPLSNNATILSVPVMNQSNILPEGMDPNRFGSLIAETSRRSYPKIPTGVGFCMLISRDTLHKVGAFDPAFGLGYGEENDFCMRARDAGKKIVCCDDAYVHHYGEASFGSIKRISEKRKLNERLLEQKWPGYKEEIYRFCCINPLREIQERIFRSIKELETSVLPDVLHVLHNFDAPGGTELHTRNIIDGLSSRFHSTVLFPASLPEQWIDLAAREVTGHLRVLKLRRETVVVTDSFLEMHGDLTNEYVETIFSNFLRGSSPSIVHFQHLGGWSSLLLPLIAKDQDRKVVISLHDYYLLCPEYNLILPDLRRCGKTLADSEDAECLYCLGTKRKYHGAGKPSLLRDYLAERKQIIKRVFEAADILVAPSDFVRERFIQAYGEAIKSRIVTVPHGIQPLQKSQQAKRGNVLRVGFLGNASDRKGAFVLLQAAKILKGKPIRLEIFGGVPPSLTKTADDLGIIQHGFYERSDLPRLLSKTSLVMIPSVWDETFCLTASESQMMGIPVIASDCGAISERIVDGETGFLVPPGNAKALAARLLEILDDPTRLERVAANLRDSRLKTMEENIEDYAQVYDRLLDIRESRESEDQTNSTPDRPERELTSIVILTFNELDYSKKCVESIRRHTPEPHEIIFVDNGSKDGTVKWLKKLVNEHSHYKLIENGKNLGFAKGCNQGIGAATGNHILLLNNDTVVTDRWLSGMLECLKSTPEAGIVGPTTNNISGVQKVERVGYDAIEGLENYARSFREKNRHRRTEARRVVGFCMLFRRSLVDQIGLLDESFGTGNFEDDDFCARAALAGYRNVIAGDVFIHHFGSRSFIGNRIDYGSSLTGNRKIYNDKWRDIEQKPHEGRKIRALVARELAWKSSQQGNVKGAVDLYLSAIQQDPQDKRNYTELAQMLIQSGRHGDALDALRQCPIGAEDADRLVLEGQCREGLNELEEAGNLADLALSMNEVHAPALNLKGTLAFRQNAAEKAREYFEKAAAADPSWGEPLTNLGVLLWTAGERDESIDLLEKGFILSPHVVDLAERYHAAAVSLGAYLRAEKVFREARNLCPSSRTIVFLLIDLLISQGDHGTAMEEIEAAMAAFETDDGFITAALEVRNKIGPLKIKEKAKGDTLSLCMIVKNEQPNLVRCLSSVKAVVDEIIVVDTGSTDRTKDIAAVFGAKVFDFAWDEDFSHARNFSLSKAGGNWILVIDADETVSSRDHERLRSLIRKSPNGIGGYDLTTRNYVIEPNTAGWTANDGSYRDEEAGTGWYPNLKVRLFRRDPRIRFSGAVHELVEPSMLGAGMKIVACDVPVHHTGKLDRVRVTEKGERYFLLGMKKIEETGGTPRAILELAIQAGELGRYDDAIRLWRRYLDGKPAQDVSRACVNLINACLNADRFDEALDEARKAAAHANGTRELLLNCAAAEFFAGDVRKAIKMTEKILKNEPDYPPALSLLAICCALAGHAEAGTEHLQRLHETGLEPRSQILPVIEKLRKVGKKDQADKLLILMDWQPRTDNGPTPPSLDRSRQDSGCSVQR